VRIWFFCSAQVVVLEARWQNMMQETTISKDGDFAKHCLEIWQLCFAI
jgi:hypothetical protein